jgi:hypothetical protein
MHGLARPLYLCRKNIDKTKIEVIVWINSRMYHYQLSHRWNTRGSARKSSSVAQNLLVTGSHLEPMTRLLLSIWRLRVSWYGAPSLTWGWVGNLLVQFLLGLARAVILGSKSPRTHGHILLSHLGLPQPGGPGPRIYIPQKQWPSYIYTRALGSLLLLVRTIGNIQIQFVLHRKHITSPLQRPTG